MNGNKTFNAAIGLVILALVSACSDVKFSDAGSVAPSGIGGDGGGTRDPGSDPNDPGTRDPGTDPNNPGTGGPRDPGTDVPGTLNKYSQTVALAGNKVDFLLVIDDSTSMLQDQQKLAAKLSGFAEKLTSLAVDWQMCVTVTRDQYIGTKTGTAKSQDVANWRWGLPIDWSGNSGSSPFLLRKAQNLTTAQIDTMVKATINKIGAGAPESGDERGIKAAYHSFSKDSTVKSSNCYRDGSAVSVILISDEDERSVGGVESRIKTQAERDEKVYRLIEKEDKPEELLARAKSVFGANTRFTFNSIIVKSNDMTCEAEQDTQGSPSHAGTFYERISTLTNGAITSICEADYSKNLELFAGLITNYQKEFALDCEPVAASFKVKVSNSSGADITSTVSYVFSGANIIFNKDLVQGTKLDFEYYCK